jgi:phage gp29-like protein
MQSEGGEYGIVPDTRAGAVDRPFATSQMGARTATLETLFDYFIDHVPRASEAEAQDPDIRSKLHNNSDVQAAMRKRSFTVSTMPWDVVPAEDAPEKTLAEKIARYVKWVFNQLPSMRSLHEEMQDAILPGGIGVEFTWVREADGSERPVQFWSVDCSRFLFDRMGNLAIRTRDYPVWGAYVGANPGDTRLARHANNRSGVLSPIPGKFIYHVHRRQAGMWQRPELEAYQYYGVGEDVALYIPVTFDAFVLRFTMKWLEKYGMPPTILYHPDTRTTASNAQVMAVVESLRGESIITIPKMAGKEKNHYYEIEQLNVPSPAYDAFMAFHEKRTKPAIDGILLGSAEENQKSESGKGGYSDHVSRRDAGPVVFFTRDANRISDTINSQLIPYIVQYGPFSGVPSSYYPKHVMQVEEDKDQKQQLELLGETSKYVSVKSQDFYDRAGIQKPGPDDEVVGGNPQSGETDPFDVKGHIPGATGVGKMPASPIGQGGAAGEGSLANEAQ